MHSALRLDETLRWATEDLQRLLAELLCDVMTQRPHKRADLLVVGLKQVIYDELMSKGDFALSATLPSCIGEVHSNSHTAIDAIEDYGDCCL